MPQTIIFIFYTRIYLFASIFFEYFFFIHFLRVWVFALCSECLCMLSGILFAFDIKTHKILKLPHSVDVTRGFFSLFVFNCSATSIIIFALCQPTTHFYIEKKCERKGKREREKKRRTNENLIKWTTQCNVNNGTLD